MHALRKGNAWRFKVQQFLESLGMEVTRRGIGDAGDDLDARFEPLAWSQAPVRFSVEAKNRREFDLAGYVDQAERQAPEGTVPVVFLHRPGKASVEDGYVVMTGRAFARLMQ